MHYIDSEIGVVAEAKFNPFLSIVDEITLALVTEEGRDSPHSWTNCIIGAHPKFAEANVTIGHGSTL